MPKVIEILLDFCLVAVIMTLLISICSFIMKDGGIVQTGFTDAVQSVFTNIESKLSGTP